MSRQLLRQLGLADAFGADYGNPPDRHRTLRAAELST
jgi:hypothetical protein